MQIMGLGIDYRTGELLMKPMDSQDFAVKIWESLNKNIQDITQRTYIGSQALLFRGEVERRPTDLGNPREAGWTYIVNEKDPQKEEISRILQPLAKHRGMKDPESPMIFSGETEEEWFDWLQENYYSIEHMERPYYVAIVGGPESFPFRLQSFLDMVTAVGRLDFDSLDGLKAYVEKVLRLEKASEPVVDRRALIFAPDGGTQDPTYFSHHYMAEPLAKHICDKCQFQTTTIAGEAATKKELESAFLNGRPALVYTASHGLKAKASESLEIQKQVNGTICCQHSAGEPLEYWGFSGDDVPFDRPFLEGAAFFQFACFGYGTPAESDYSHWFGEPELNCEQDFVAALPKKLLSHPSGPIAFVGHLDAAWLHGFDDPDNPYPAGYWHPRMSPFISAVNKLLDTQPVGLAMDEMNARYGIGNAQLSNFLDRVKRKKASFEASWKWLVDTFITRSDAQNYMILGDPAVRLRIPSGN
jgi:hypothetical protein